MQMFIMVYIVFQKCLLVSTNYSFYEVTAFNPRERYWLHKFHETQKDFIFLNGVTNEASTAMDVVVKDCCTQDFETKLDNYNIDYKCVARHVTFPLEFNETHLRPFDVSKTFLNWDDILFWVDEKIKDNSAMTKIVIANTYEHRDIFMLKISTSQQGNRMAILIVGGEEGRDWLSSALLLNYIDISLKSATKSDSLLNYYDIYLIPILNPDGFVHSKQQDRFWAKNKKHHPAKICLNNSAAVGVNIDRNWLLTKPDSNDNACNAVFHGYKSLSEEETMALSYVLDKIANKLLAFINLRGFENLLVVPYSDNIELSINHNVMMEIMKHTSTILKIMYDTIYPIGTTGNYFYNFSGNMADWVKRKLNIPIVFTVYMQLGNFLPEPSHVQPLSNHLTQLLHTILTISRDIYGSLYNIGVRHTCTCILITINYVCQ